MTAPDPMSSAEATALVETARGPDDLFEADAARAYRRLAQLIHPDTCPGDSRAAHAFAKLAALWRQYQDGHGVLVARGDIANLYQVRDGLLKLVRDPADNDLMRAETIALAALRTRVEPPLQAYFPEPVRAQRRRDPSSGVERRANVIAWLAGFRSLAEVRDAFPRRRRPAGRGVDVAAPAAACWPARAGARPMPGCCWPSSTNCSAGSTAPARSAPSPCRPRDH
jgi:hypothetical protein